MNGTIRLATAIGIILLVLILIAAPVSAASWSTQSSRFTTVLNPVSAPVFVTSPPGYLNGQYATLNNFLTPVQCLLTEIQSPFHR